ncbi:MBL fold metallo-hydrolase [Myxococcota bacterium]|nr:MBL fold metallo-hydrolase [Myxococcota bacterium]MBU1537244.1 MBL fold metallo-hydrolase [Myxococcota bacterium]
MRPFSVVFPIIIILVAPACTKNRSDHFDGRHYCNYERTNERSAIRVIEWYLTRRPSKWPRLIPSTFGATPPVSVGPGQLSAVFVNHASVLVQFDSLNILLDPVWSERVSPVSFAGPKRVRAPGIAFSQLPPIHGVLVSHDHYDHLDMPTLKRLKNRFNPLFVVPRGCAKRFKGTGIIRVVELDWWQSTSKIGAKIYVVPARHSSGRSLADRDRTLWGGFVILSRGGPIYFAGDTGYGKHFKMIRRRFGPVRFAVLPIGAYKPRWFMRTVHMDPADAVRAHRDLEALRSMAVHFGTFPLADEPIDEPPRLLAALLKKGKIPTGRFIIPLEGMPYGIPALSPKK